MKRKHYNEIIAYAEGKDIEYSEDNLVWKDCEGYPLFLDDWYYRVKITPMVIPWQAIDPKFKFAIKTDDNCVFVSANPFTCNGYCWVTVGDGAVFIPNIILGIKHGNCDWKDSMIERPKDST